MSKKGNPYNLTDKYCVIQHLNKIKIYAQILAQYYNLLYLYTIIKTTKK